MRLNIAASVLAQSLSLAGAQELVNDRKRRNGNDIMSEGGASSELEYGRKQLFKGRNVQIYDKSEVSPSSKQVSSASGDSKPLTECDPDVGIFSCGAEIDTRCVPNNDSSLGGFCMTYQKARSQTISRSLQDGGYCEDIYIDCNCENVVDGVGSYNCTRPGECIDATGNICGTFEDDITTNADGSYTSSRCFVVEENGSAPIGQYCYTVVNDGTMTTECTLEIDQVQCNSCSPLLCPGGSVAASLDCSNIDAIAVGNSCQGGLNVLDLLSGSLTSAPTPAPTGAPVASTPMPTAEITSDASRFTAVFSSVVVAGVAGMLASLILA